MKKNHLLSLGATIYAQFCGLDIDNPSAWPLVPRVFLLVGLYCLTVGLLYFYPLSDQADELQKLVGREHALRIGQVFVHLWRSEASGTGYAGLALLLHPLMQVILARGSASHQQEAKHQ